MALAVPLSRFTSLVGGGSAFYVRPLDHITNSEHHTIMKFSNGTEFRFGTPKYSKTSRRLICICGGCVLISWLVSEPAKAWFDGVGRLTVIAYLAVYLAGMIAERKEREAAHKIDDSK